MAVNTLSGFGPPTTAAVDFESPFPVVVELRGAGRTYGGASPVVALHECHVVIRRGEFVAIMGPSCSGKSTMLNILGLLDAPTQGEYLLDGAPTAGLSEGARADVWGVPAGVCLSGVSPDRVSQRGRKRRGGLVVPESRPQFGGSGRLMCCSGLGWATDCGRPHRSYLVASVSVWPLHGHWSVVRRCCYAMNRPAIWILIPVLRCWHSWRSYMTRADSRDDYSRS